MAIVRIPRANSKMSPSSSSFTLVEPNSCCNSVGDNNALMNPSIGRIPAIVIAYVAEFTIFVIRTIPTKLLSLSIPSVFTCLSHSDPQSSKVGNHLAVLLVDSGYTELDELTDIMVWRIELKIVVVNIDGACQSVFVVRLQIIVARKVCLVLESCQILHNRGNTRGNRYHLLRRRSP